MQQVAHLKKNFLHLSNVYIKRIESLDPVHIAEIDGSASQQAHLFQVQIYFQDKTQGDLMIKAQQLGTPHLYEIVINGAKKCQELITHFNKDFALMTENLRIMANRMVLLNPLVSLLKK